MGRWGTTTLAVAVISALAAPALAASTAALAPGGRTLAGPGTASIAIAGTETVFSNGDRDACATVVNSGRSTLQLSVTAGTTTAITIDAGDSAALCRLALEQVDLICTGTTACAAQWRVDDN
ncbi:MAG: hypothetical protein FJ108_07770 [Deltaproteobacteria bacterium]|nr:hypothetical protein [Deltaproteobacteria bacterium]